MDKGYLSFPKQDQYGYEGRSITVTLNTETGNEYPKFVAISADVELEVYKPDKNDSGCEIDVNLDGVSEVFTWSNGAWVLSNNDFFYACEPWYTWDYELNQRGDVVEEFPGMFIDLNHDGVLEHIITYREHYGGLSIKVFDLRKNIFQNPVIDYYVPSPA